MQTVEKISNYSKQNGMTFRMMTFHGLVLLGLAFSPVSSQAITNNLALTPPMGWNSWNNFGGNVSDVLVRYVADAMATNGMKAAGYEYVNMDDDWQVGRDSNGVILADPIKFPYGIKALADFVHSKGLKFGLYSDHGYATCGGRPGSYGYEYVDANTYALWGVDFLKYDNCNWPANDDPQEDYTRMSDALMKCGRPITFSLCYWNFDSWEPRVGNLWRTTADINDSYDSIVSKIDENSQSAFVAGPGRWNDPDMLEVGNGGMTAAENQTHFTMWCIMAAPLIAGNDVVNMSAQTLAILTNPEAIAVDQDPAGEQGVKVVNNVSSSSATEVWSKTLGYDFTTKAVVLFNRSGAAANITCNWTNLGLQAGTATVRDLWAHKDLGTFTNSFTTNVASHAAVMLKVVGTPPPAPLLGITYLSDMQPIYSYTGWSSLMDDKSIGGNALKLGGVTYAKGLGVHSFSGVEYNLGGVASRFQAVIGVDDEMDGFGPGSVDFQVYADGMLIYDSGVMLTNTPAKTIDLDVTGVSRLVLGVDDADDGINFDHADWANALVTVTNVTPVSPRTPTGLNANMGAAVNLAWNAVPGTFGYNIKRSSNAGNSYMIIGTSPVAAFADTSAVTGQSYDYVVSATNQFAESADSEAISVVPCSPPAAPSNVSVTFVNSNALVSWNPVPGATNYSVARATSDTPYTTIASGLTGTNYTDVGLHGGETYYYIVSADNGCAEGTPSQFVAGALFNSLEPARRLGVGINFVGSSGSTPESMTYTDTAGAVPQTNWNNVDLAGNDSGGIAQIIGPNPGVLSDNAGHSTGMTFSYAAQGMWSVDQSPHTQNQMLLDGYSDVRNSANGVYQFGNIPYDMYDVYVYVSADVNYRAVGVDINGGPQTYLLTAAAGYNYADPLICGTATTPGTATAAHYAQFPRVTGANLQVNVNWLGDNVGLAAVQIVASQVWLTNSWDGTDYILNWPGNGQLLQATNVRGPWITNVGASSPFKMKPNKASEFFKVQIQP